MNFPFYIAKRYLFSKKSTNVINLISLITIVGVAVGTIALVVILSVFDGLESFVTSRFNSFDSDLKISSVSGKSFNVDSPEIIALKKHSNILYYAEVIEENALIKYGEIYHPFKLKGVGSEFENMTGIDSMILEGNFRLYYDSVPLAVIGSGVAGFLSVNINQAKPLKVYMPDRKGKIQNISSDPTKAFKISNIHPIAVFSIDQEVDEYIIVPIEFARQLMNYDNKATSIELKVRKSSEIDKTKKEIEKLLGKNFYVKNRYQQKEYIYKIMKSEKLIIYFILTFILVIATFNLIGSLTMLILDKKDDISTLRSMGANIKMIKQIFWLEGWMISIIGAIIGLGVGALLCWLQVEFELIKLQGDADRLFITAYPVELNLMNFVYVLGTVLFIGSIVSWFPARFITRKYTLLR